MAGVEHEEMFDQLQPSSMNYSGDSTTIDVVKCMKPYRSTQITSTCYTTQAPPPSHNETLPLEHSSPLTIEPSVLPSYEEMTLANAPPPSYDSIYGRIREARNQSNGTFEFLMTAVMLLLGTIGCTILFGVLVVIPFIMIIIGALYLHECPQSKYIPIYLLVSGSLGVFNQLLDWSGKASQRQGEKNTSIQNLIGFLMFVLFFAGSALVYKEYEPNYDPSLGNYCNKTLYLFAFWQLTVTYICIGAMMFLSCCIVCLL